MKRTSTEPSVVQAAVREVGNTERPVTVRVGGVDSTVRAVGNNTDFVVVEHTPGNGDRVMTDPIPRHRGRR
ncbi:hypothetical protein AB0L00_42930 [Actinoallomurus sp. NPDC052308]|uniref:hypothetical protein n=1 Tax=Actinoallomurus sp. NPDC052308 TaxID=3155530 RepID=UPI0034317908